MDMNPVWLTFLAQTDCHWAVMLYTDTAQRLNWSTGANDDLDAYIEKTFPMYIDQYLVVEHRSDAERFKHLGFKVKVNKRCYPMRKARAFAEMRDTGLLYLPGKEHINPAQRFKAGGKEIARYCDGPLCGQVVPSAMFSTPQSMICGQCEAMYSASDRARKSLHDSVKRDQRRL